MKFETFRTTVGATFAIVFFLLADPVGSITVSPSYTGSKDLIYLPSVSFNAGQRLYEPDITFGTEQITAERSGRKLLFLIRNDFVFSDRFTIGFNLGTGTLDYGTLEKDTDTLDTKGDIGAGGGLRISGMMLEDVMGADWFTDFQFFSLASDPDGGRISQNDMRLAFGGRRQIGSAIVEGGLQYNTSKFQILASSKNDTTVEGSGEAATKLGLFINTRFPLTELVDGFAEVQFTDEISFNIGASYRYKLGSYTPPVVRQPVSGARFNQRPEQGESARSYVQKARRAINQEKFQNALDFLSKAVDLDPESPDVFFQIGRSYYLVGEFGRAVQYLNHAVDLNDEVASYHYFLARAYDQLGRTRQAVTHYERTVGIDPTHKQALYRLNQLEGN